ncbi:LpqB family beta-propeller domain-containing protein [Nonomuraea sp. NPDC026600]|uniref:LpqB family beta-propeller domain-containing protein n=1 Tax=Nonomuraea sp. NPDC026600 TaxID=3155363 RepID=UPI0033CCC844
MTRTRPAMTGAGRPLRARLRRLGAVGVVVATLTWSSACAVIPVGGPFPVSEAGDDDPMSKPFQRMVAIAPQPGWSPQQVVEGLQAAMAAYADDPEILAKYLTDEARQAWKPGGPVTVLDNGAKYDESGKIGDKEVTVSLSGTQVARIEDDDTYVPVSVGVDRKFTLVKDKTGEYRVNSLVGGLVLTEADVARAYRPTNLYYLNGAPGSGGASADMLVVDRVRLRLKPTESFAKTIIERLLEGPSKALQGAVENVFPQGTRVESVRAGDDRVVINLSGPIDSDDIFSRGLQAQLRWSLTSNNVANGRSIEVQLDGEPFYSSDTLTIPANMPDDWLGTSSGVVYYSNSKGAVYSVGTDGPGRAVAGPAGQPNGQYSDFAVIAGGYATGQGADLIAAKSRTGGIWVARAAADGHWQQWIQGASADLTPPSWHRDGTLWTYDGRSGAVLRCNPSAGRGPERIAAPSLDGFDVTGLRIARDGVRVAVTIGKHEIRVGAITGQGASTMLGNFQTLSTVDEEEIMDLAWRDGEHLVVLSQSKAGSVVKEINVGDGTVTKLPSDKRLRTLGAQGERILAGTLHKNEILESNLDKQSWTSKITTDADTPIFPLG